jgi:hypothetical protein
MMSSRPPRPIPGVLYVPYVECPRVEKPPAKNIIARMMRMMRSKTAPPFCSILLGMCKPLFLIVDVSVLNYDAWAKHIQACAVV